MESLLTANPILRTTLQTRGSKGRHIWFFAEGEYPTGKKRIICDEYHEGQKIERDELCPCGSGKVYKLCCEKAVEFMSEHLCTIWGTHYKTGQPYQMVKKTSPILFNLDDLKLPAGFAWEVKVSSNGHRKGTFTGGFRANGSSSANGKKRLEVL